MNKYERFLLEVGQNMIDGHHSGEMPTFNSYYSADSYGTTYARGHNDFDWPFDTYDTRIAIGPRPGMFASSEEHQQYNHELGKIFADAASTKNALHFAEDVVGVLTIATMLLTLITGLFGIKSAWNFYRKIKQAAINVNICNKLKEKNQKNQCKIRLYKTTKAELMALRSQCSTNKNSQNCVAKFNKQIAKIDNMIYDLTRGQQG